MEAYGFSLCATFFGGQSSPTSPSSGSNTAKKSMDLSRSSWISGIPRGKNPQFFFADELIHELHFSQKIIKNGRGSSENGVPEVHRWGGGSPYLDFRALLKSKASFVQRLKCFLSSQNAKNRFRNLQKIDFSNVWKQLISDDRNIGACGFIAIQNYSK